MKHTKFQDLEANIGSFGTQLPAGVVQQVMKDQHAAYQESEALTGTVLETVKKLYN